MYYSRTFIKQPPIRRPPLLSNLVSRALFPGFGGGGRGGGTSKAREKRPGDEVALLSSRGHPLPVPTRVLPLLSPQLSGHQALESLRLTLFQKYDKGN